MGGYNLDSKLSFLQNDKTKTYITPELRAYASKFADPLSLNFKLMIDYGKESGLFADETIVNSALAYLNRIGELERYEALKHWINVFKDFIKNYDFLILECEGIDSIVNIKPYEVFNEDDDQVSFTIRETSDMRFQSLLTQWRHIWFDDIRGVEVIPANLRRFDINILVYSAGYYNMALYDVLENVGIVDNSNERKMFPTIKKLSDEYFIANGKYEFNHHIINIVDCQIKNEESGKTFFSSLSNDTGGEQVKNTLSLKYRFASYKGVFNNIFGEFDFVKVLAIASAQNRISNEIIFDNQFNDSIEDETKRGLHTLFAESDSRFEQKSFATRKIDQYKNKLIGKNSVIGAALSRITDKEFAKNAVKSTANYALTQVENKYINGPIARINNRIFSNFSDNFFTAYETYLKPKNEANRIKVEEPIVSSTNKLKNKIKTIDYQPTIYTRPGL